jgi:hypothetical protein
VSTFTRLWKARPRLAALTRFEVELRKRWGETSAEKFAESLLARARVIAPLLGHVAEELRAEFAQESQLGRSDLTRVFVPDDSGTSRSLREMERDRSLDRYLDFALKAELIRLDRWPALWRQP